MRRTAILPSGGDKAGDNRFYKRFVPLAARLQDEHLKELRVVITNFSNAGEESMIVR